MNVRLLQNCIESKHFDEVQRGFEPLDFRHNPHPELREFQIFRELYERGEYLRSDVLGAVSIRFKAKSLFDGDHVRRWIESNPGYDVYIVNPNTQHPYIHKNHFQFSENTRDPLFTAKSQDVFDRIGIAFDLFNIGHQTNDILSASSYWFGTPDFWHAYMNDVVLPVLNAGRDVLGDKASAFLYEPQFYYGVAAHPCGSLPFLLERTVSLYLAQNRNIKAKFYPVDRQRVLDCCLFTFEREIVSLYGDMVDRWIAEDYSGPEMDDYFRWSSRMVGAGWRLYFKQHPISFEGGENPRKAFPWFKDLQSRR